MKQLIILIATIFFIQACKSTDTAPTPNRPPNTFTVKTTLKSDGKTIVLNWTKAKDPDGDVVTYSVVLKDTLAKKLTDTTYIISKLDYNYTQTGKVIAKDAKGLNTEAAFTANTEVSTTFKIPDANFEKYLVTKKIDSDGAVNGQMYSADAIRTDSLLVDSLNIKSLVGIEYFTNIKKLDCMSNQLTALDVSKNSKLTWLNCSYNQLTSIDISKNISLLIFYCVENKLTNLNVTKNTGLTDLLCDNNSLTSLDVTKNTNLNVLGFGGTLLTGIDLSKNINLKKLTCFYSKLTSLDVTKNINLTFLVCGNNSLTSLDVTKNINLTLLLCNFNKLTSLDLSKNISLISMICNINNIKTICVADVVKANANKGWQKDVSATYAVCK